MKKFILALISSLSIIGCSSSNDTTRSTPISETTTSASYSPKKQQYMKSCVGTSQESFCSCQFDAMDPILSESIGNDWPTRNIEEKDFEKYISAVEIAVSECS